MADLEAASARLRHVDRFRSALRLLQPSTSRNQSSGPLNDLIFIGAVQRTLKSLPHSTHLIDGIPLRPDFYYNNAICESHKKDVSSLAYCHNHKKLSDIRKMCEVCLLSFATEKESDCNTYKSLVGILHKDLECFVEDDNCQVVSLPPVGKKDEGLQMEKVGGGGDDCCCSCCGESLKVKSSNSKGKNGSTFSQAPAPSPRAGFVPAFRNEDKTSLELPHVNYTELKLLSDSESEFVEDDEGLHGRNLDAHQFKEDVKPVKVPLLPEPEDVHESSRTPIFGRGNKFFGIPLTDSDNTSPRWAIRISRKSPLERPELPAENYEADMLGPGDNDSILNCLKRQVRIDRKSLMELYMELDEERSASAVAANNAMAMITRLQAEKAAVQMEALQYQRMMEEQEEYDQEALQATNDLLAKREEEIRDLEVELEAYREKYGYLEEGCLQMSEGEMSDEDYQEFKSQVYLSSDEKSECNTPFSLNGREKENFKNFDRTIIPSGLKIERENSKEESTNNHGVALPFSQGKAEGEDSKEDSTNNHGVALPFSQGEAEGEDSKEESTNNHEVALPFSQGKSEGEDSKEKSINNHGVTLPFSQGKAEGEDSKEESTNNHAVQGEDSKEEGTNNHGVALTFSQGEAEGEDSKEESTINHGVALPFSQGKAEGEDSKEESTDNHGVALPSQGKAEGEDSKEESTNNHGVALPSKGKAEGEDSKEESTNKHGVALPFSQGKAEGEDSKEVSTNNHGVALPFSQGKAEGEDSKEVRTNNHGVALPFSQGKAEGEDSKEVSTNNHGVALAFSRGKAEGEDQNEPLTNFKGEKTYLLGRLKRSKKNINSLSSEDLASSLQPRSASVNRVDEVTGKGRALTRKLSHLNEFKIMRVLKADNEVSKHEGKVSLAETSHNLGKPQNLVDQNNICFISRMYIVLYDALNIDIKLLEAQQLLTSSIAMQS
ncbi:putative myosin-binding protein 5, partial [Cucurbita argyrosperma subsp. sororia]